MTNRQRDSLAAVLRQIADDLEGAKEHATKRAAENADKTGITGTTRETFTSAFVEGWVADAATSTAARLRAVVDAYLVPKAPSRAAPRGRR